jgi:hypothetical protein
MFSYVIGAARGGRDTAGFSRLGASIAANDIDIKVSISFAAMQNIAIDIDIICGSLMPLAVRQGDGSAGANLCCRGT